MPGETIKVAGLPIPLVSRFFLTMVGFHVVVGLTCVMTGIVAMVSRKRRGRHSTFGTIHYWSLSAVFVSATILAVIRWAEDYHLFILGVLSFAAAFWGRMALRRRWSHWVRLHITGMGLSYVLFLNRLLRGQREKPAALERVSSDCLLAVARCGRHTAHCSYCVAAPVGAAQR